MRTAGYARQGLIPTPKKSVEYFIDGQDEPETVIGHGLTKTIAGTRPPVRRADGHGRCAFAWDAKTAVCCRSLPRGD
jgi:hypothetical protein